MDAHKQMGGANMRFEDVERAATENKRSVAQTLQIFEATVEKDRANHQNEYREHGS